MSCHSDLHPLYYSIEKYPGITRFILYTSNDPEMHRRLAKSVLLNLLKHTEEKHRKVVGHSSPLMHTRRVEDSSTGFFAWRALLGGPSCIWLAVSALLHLRSASSSYFKQPWNATKKDFLNWLMCKRHCCANCTHMEAPLLALLLPRVLPHGGEVKSSKSADSAPTSQEPFSFSIYVLIVLLAPQSGALRRGAYRDLQFPYSSIHPYPSIHL